MPNYLSHDSHAGGSIGLLLGVIFLAFGITLTVVPNSDLKVPFWQKSFGIFITFTGIVSLVLGIVFMCLPAPHYEAKEGSTDVVLLLKNDVVSFANREQEVKRDWEDISLGTEIYLPSSLKVDDQYILHVNQEYKIESCTAIYVHEVVMVICVVVPHSNNSTRFLLRYIITPDQSLLMERFPIDAQPKEIKMFKDTYGNFHMTLDGVPSYCWNKITKK